ncbi:MAG: hypothetical protein AVO34_00215 [Firmicutes bacterium ML8_F2]|jgi:trk system potassium uptake protein|nr:MAG: hypothetical protein AVO34_00215 [Firmicutes bacterium ML8_F2]
MKKSFLVIGAGRFGTSVARTLFKLGHDVMVVDNDEIIIQHISDEVTNALVADVSNESSLRALGVRDFDAVVLAIGFDIQASIMVAILLTEMGAQHIVAKAQNDLHGKVLKKVGINRVVYPERDTGQKIALSLISPSIIDLIELSADYSIVEVEAPGDMVGKSLQDLNLRARFGITVIALRRFNNGCHPIIAPIASDTIGANDLIVAIGQNKSLKKLGWS